MQKYDWLLMMAEALQKCLSRFPKIDTLKAEQSEAGIGSFIGNSYL